MQDGGLDDDIKPSFHSFRDNSFRLRRGSVDTEDLRKEEQMKLEEAARIEENGPYLEPGLIDHICVVGPKGSGTRINMSTKGWIGKFFSFCTTIMHTLFIRFAQNEAHSCDIL